MLTFHHICFFYISLYRYTHTYVYTHTYITTYNLNTQLVVLNFKILTESSFANNL